MSVRGTQHIPVSTDSPTYAGLTITGTGERITGLASGNYIDFNDSTYITIGLAGVQVATTPHIIDFANGNLTASGYTAAFRKIAVGGTDPEKLLIKTNDSTVGGYAALIFGSSNTGIGSSEKGGVFFERTDTNGRGKLLFCVENTADTSLVDNTDVALTINADKSSTFASTVSAVAVLRYQMFTYFT